MVGLGRLELPTSPLSGARSSHLSYRPNRIEEYSERDFIISHRKVPNRWSMLFQSVLGRTKPLSRAGFFPPYRRQFGIRCLFQEDSSEICGTFFSRFNIVDGF